MFIIIKNNYCYFFRFGIIISNDDTTKKKIYAQKYHYHVVTITIIIQIILSRSYGKREKKYTSSRWNEIKKKV